MSKKSLLFVPAAVLAVTLLNINMACAAEDLVTVNRQNGDREYNFEYSTDTYTATKQMGTAGTGTFNINGVKGEDGSYSTIDLNGKKGIRVKEGTTLNLNNVHITNGYSDGDGGALYVYQGAEVGSITGAFTNNKAEGNGGAIHVKGHVGSIVADFIGNETEGGNGKVGTGSAINIGIGGKIDYINGKFINNAGRGAVIQTQESSIVGTIDGYYEGNVRRGTTNSNYGATVIWANRSTISNILGKYTKNRAIDKYTPLMHIDNRTKVDNINVTMNENTGGSVIWLGNGSEIHSLTGTFEKNLCTSEYSLIHTYSSKIDTIHDAKFLNNYSVTAGFIDGGIIYLQYTTVNTIKDSLFEGNKTSGGDRNYEARGGAIYVHNGKVGEIVNTDFIDNSVEGGDGSRGGAIYTKTDLKISANNGTSTFKGNTATENGETTDNGIYLGWTGEGDNGNEKTISLTLNTENNGEIFMYDNISSKNKNNAGEYKYNTVNITGDGTGTYHMLNDINKAHVQAGNTTISTINDEIHTYKMYSFSLNSDTKFAADVDLANEQMDRIVTNNNYPTLNGNLNVVGLNLISDAKKDNTEILFAESGLAQNVTSDLNGQTLGQDVEHQYQTTGYSPIYKYKVNYKIKDDDQGYFTFERLAKSNGGSNGSADKPTYNAINPAIMASPVAAQFGGFISQLNSYDEAFNNLDMKMLLTRKQRQALKLKNKYAMADMTLLNLPTSNTESLAFSRNDIVFDPTVYQYEDRAFWTKPYATFEKVSLKHGPKVNNTMYGTFFGGDSEIKELSHGWDFQWGSYAGYNGSHQSYSGNSIYQNGGNLGASAMWYKGNYFGALTANVGASVAEASTMYGHEDFPMLMAGVAAKTGYNFELAKGKFIIQPHYLMSYSFINAFDYTNAAGVRINSDPLHAINITPGIKFIGNLENGWQPYATVQMSWNIMDRTEFKAQDVQLPELSVKPYIQYGVGLQKRWGERFTGYIQAMIRNGGRNGIALGAGFRWAIGQKSTEKVQRDTKIRKRVELKSINRHS